jgi:hypothetical protein
MKIRSSWGILSLRVISQVPSNKFSKIVHPYPIPQEAHTAGEGWGIKKMTK